MMVLQRANFLVLISFFIVGTLKSWPRMFTFFPEGKNQQVNHSPNELIMGYIPVIQELKKRFKVPHQKAAKNSIMCQTKAYLSIPSLKKQVEEVWFSKLPFSTNKFLKKIISQEEKYADTHYAFYHAQKGIFRIFHDFLKELYKILQIEKDFSDFVFLRSWVNAPKTIDSNIFIDETEKKYGWHHCGWSDSLLSKEMLCANLSLFGNTSKRHSGECTLQFFKTNSNIGAPSLHYLLSPIFNHFGLDTRFITDLKKLIDYADTDKANLVQIFIPKQKVNQCTYLAHAFGTPWRSKIVASIYNKAKERHTHIAPLLHKYCSKLSEINKVDNLQARLIFSKDLLLNPNSGVKILRHTLVPEKKLAQYEKKVKELVQTIISDRIKSEISNDQTIAQTPMGRLMRYTCG